MPQHQQNNAPSHEPQPFNSANNYGMGQSTSRFQIRNKAFTAATSFVNKSNAYIAKAKEEGNTYLAKVREDARMENARRSAAGRGNDGVTGFGAGDGDGGEEVTKVNAERGGEQADRGTILHGNDSVKGQKPQSIYLPPRSASPEQLHQHRGASTPPVSYPERIFHRTGSSLSLASTAATSASGVLFSKISSSVTYFSHAHRERRRKEEMTDEKVVCFPGWAVLKPCPKDPSRTDCHIEISGYVYRQRPLSAASRPQKIFVGMAKSLAAPPRIPQHHHGYVHSFTHPAFYRHHGHGLSTIGEMGGRASTMVPSSSGSTLKNCCAIPDPNTNASPTPFDPMATTSQQENVAAHGVGMNSDGVSDGKNPRDAAFAALIDWAGKEVRKEERREAGEEVEAKEKGKDPVGGEVEAQSVSARPPIKRTYSPEQIDYSAFAANEGRSAESNPSVGSSASVHSLSPLFSEPSSSSTAPPSPTSPISPSASSSGGPKKAFSLPPPHIPSRQSSVASSISSISSVRSGSTITEGYPAYLDSPPIESASSRSGVYFNPLSGEPYAPGMEVKDPETLKKMNNNLNERLRAFFGHKLEGRMISVEVWDGGVDSEDHSWLGGGQQNGGEGKLLGRSVIKTGAGGSFKESLVFKWDGQGEGEAGTAAERKRLKVTCRLLPDEHAEPTSTVQRSASEPVSPVSEDALSIGLNKLHRVTPGSRVSTISESVSSGGGEDTPSRMVERPIVSDSVILPLRSGREEIAVISDLDDTIRHTSVLSGIRTILSNVFLLDHLSVRVPGMSEFYNEMEKKGGVGFHYVSNSPIELAGAVKQFLDVCGMPKGQIRLKTYGKGGKAQKAGGGSPGGGGGGGGGSDEDGSAPGSAPSSPGGGMLGGMWEGAAARKRGGIEEIFRAFPRTKFIMIGDSGEQDIELYTGIAKQFPKQSLAIFIRDVTTPMAKKRSTSQAPHHHHHGHGRSSRQNSVIDFSANMSKSNPGSAMPSPFSTPANLLSSVDSHYFMNDHGQYPHDPSAFAKSAPGTPANAGGHSKPKTSPPFQPSHLSRSVSSYDDISSPQTVSDLPPSEPLPPSFQDPTTDPLSPNNPITMEPTEYMMPGQYPGTPVTVEGRRKVLEAFQKRVAENHDSLPDGVVLRIFRTGFDCVDEALELIDRTKEKWAQQAGRK